MSGIKVWGTAALVLAAVAAGGYYAYTSLAGNQFNAALDRAFAQLPLGYSASYKTAKYSPASSEGDVTGFTLHKADPQGFDIAVEDVEFSKPALDFATAWSQAAANPAAVTPDTVLPLAGRITLKGVTFHSGPMSGSIASLAGEGLRVYPWSVLQPGLPSWPEALAVMQQPHPPTADLASVQPLLRFVASWALAVGYDRFAQDDLKMTAKIPIPPRNALTDATYAIRHMSSSGVDRGVFADGAAEGYKLQYGPETGGSVERVAMSGIDMRKPLTQALTKPTLVPDMLDGLAIGRIEYGGMTFAIPGQKPISIGTITVSKLAFSGAVPVSGELAVSGVSVSRAQLNTPQAAEAFAKLDLDKVTLSAGAAYRWDLAQKHIALPDVTLTLNELGTLDLSLDVNGVVPGAAAALQAQLGHAVLRYSDHSFIERALRAGAAMAGTDPAAYRRQLVAMVEARAASFGDNAALQAAAKEVIAFLNAPQSLTIELSPPRPVPMMMLFRAGTMPPPELVAMLGLSVSANR